MKDLFRKLRNFGGKIVSSNDCSVSEIEQARVEHRMFVDENGFGYIWFAEI